MRRVEAVLHAVSLAAAMMLVAQSEWMLAIAVGWPAWVAWGAPVALDSYVLAAVVGRRDVGPAILVSAASVLISHGIYATAGVWSSGVVGQGRLVWWAAATMSIVPLLVAWRVHSLGSRPTGRTADRRVVTAGPARSADSESSPIARPTQVAIGSGRQSGRQSGRSLPELQAALTAAIESAELPDQPTATAIREHLRVSQGRARLLREWVGSGRVAVA